MLEYLAIACAVCKMLDSGTKQSPEERRKYERKRKEEYWREQKRRREERSRREREEWNRMALAHDMGLI